MTHPPERRVLVATAGDLLFDLRRPITPRARDWLVPRQRSANWFDVSPDDEIPDDFGLPERAILHFFQLVFAPELRRRIEDGRIDESRFVLTTAQLLQPPEDQPRQVRLNAEIRGMASLRAQRQVAADDPVRVGDLRGLRTFDVDPLELDAGHFTLFWLGFGWRAFFDFRSRRARATSTLDDASEFLAAARFSAKHNHSRANVENMFNACELTAKAHLLLEPDRKLGKRHGYWHSAFRQWARHGSADDQTLARLYDREFNRRTPTRHGGADVVDPPSLDEMAFLEARIAALKQALEHKVRDDLAAA